MAMTHGTRDLSSLTIDDLRPMVADRASRALCHNTRVEWDLNGDIGIRFHATRILTFHTDGSFTASSGGWRTVTTKQRLNALMPAGYRIHSERFAWKIVTAEGTFDFCDNDRWGSPEPAPECSCSCHPFQARHGAAGSPCSGCSCPAEPAPLAGPHFHAGHNDAGYMPESDVEMFETFEAAKLFMIDDLLRAADSMARWSEEHACDDIPCPTYGDECPENLASDVTSAAEDLNLESGPEWFVSLSDGRSLPVSWWISVCAEPECAETECV